MGPGFRKMSVFGLVSAIAGFVKVRFLVDKEVTDNTVFRFHYRLTSAMFFMSCILVTANTLIGEPISCLVTDDKISKPINTYCWVMSTFTLPHQLHKKAGSQVLHPGVGDYVEGVHEKRYHAYYQWVPLMLFFQGVLFYVPHWIWKNCEQGKIKMISDGIRGSSSWNESDRSARKHKLVQYLVDSLHMHNVYAAIYFFCEVLNFANAVSTLINKDALCVMAMNILNEKIYIFLWFWLIVLALVSGLGLLYSVAITIFPSFRKSVLRRRFHFKPKGGIAALVDNMQTLGTDVGLNSVVSVQTLGTDVGLYSIVSVQTLGTDVGDFLLIHLLGQNISSYTFKEILDELTQSLNNYNKIPTRTPSRNFMEMASMYPVLPKDADI
uniref:Innexin n=1 Tax=Timema cristinae TaxID=61476 RepID=A0A7R9CY15_TIMCR|nr:unnamed protein product [Timema cristinae]